MASPPDRAPTDSVDVNKSAEVERDDSSIDGSLCLFPAEKNFITRGSFYEPLHRMYHISQCVGGKAYLFAGLFDKNLPPNVTLEQLASTVHIFDPCTELWASTHVCGELMAFAIVEVASTTLNGDLYTFGGADMYGCVTNEVHRFDTKSGQWYKLSPQNPEEGPMPKVGCGMVTFRHHLAVFGGFGVRMHSSATQSSFVYDTGSEYANGRTNEFHLFDLHEAQWIPVPLTGDVPLACSHFSLTQVSQRKAVLFGGFNAESRSAVDNVYILDLLTMHWTMLTKEKEGSWPDARQNHAACCLNFDQDFPQILVSGGVNNKLKKIHKDVWLLDVKTGTWKEVNKYHEARKGHSLVSVMLSAEKVAVLEFGGSPDFQHKVDQKKLGRTVLMFFKSNPDSSQWVLESCLKPSTLAKKKRETDLPAKPTPNEQKKDEIQCLLKNLHLLQSQLQKVQMGQYFEKKRADEAEKLLQKERKRIETVELMAQERISALEKLVSKMETTIDQTSTKIREEQRKVIEAEKLVLKEQNRAMEAEERERTFKRKMESGNKLAADDEPITPGLRVKTTRSVETQTNNETEKNSVLKLTYSEKLATEMIKRANDRVVLSEERLKAALKCVEDVQAKTQDANDMAKKAGKRLDQIGQWTQLDFRVQKKLKKE